MTYPRAHLIDAESPGFYHCISRCVRRAWLCGKDPETGRSLEHRRRWLEDRLLHLAQVFCLDVHGFAVMNNHYHLVVRLTPESRHSLSDQDVAERWISIRPGLSVDKRAAAVAELLADEERLAITRERLASLSWFMRYLNEPMAKLANKEDECTGRFWEGRFKSFALMDETAVLAAMVYVDLNPWRAGLAEQPEEGEYTSVKRRTERRDESLAPLEDLGLSLDDYVGLLHWTARVAPKGPGETMTTAWRHDQWTKLVAANACKYRAYGPVEMIEELATKLAQRWLKGAGVRRQTNNSAKVSAVF